MKQLFFCVAMLCSVSSFSQTFFGDVNHDGKIDVNDVTRLVDISLGKCKAEEIQIEDDTIKNTWSYTINGAEFPMPEAVDLGLPSGKLWASCNIGATSPEEPGLKFAWGETSIKDSYNDSNYIWGNGKLLTKYCNDSGYGNADYKNSLELNDDAAYINLGGNWRIPDETEIIELFNTQYTNNTWTSINGVQGVMVTSLMNGNYIFIPKCDSNCYWLNEIISYYPWLAKYFGVFSWNCGLGNEGLWRSSGNCIRPIRHK